MASHGEPRLFSISLVPWLRHTLAAEAQPHINQGSQRYLLSSKPRQTEPRLTTAYQENPIGADIRDEGVRKPWL